MGVYINGMRMPASCYDCDLCCESMDSEHNVYWICPVLNMDVEKYERMEDCPLVEVPEPHGRLIDADSLMNEFKILQSGREIFGMELDSSFLSSGQELSTEWYCVEDAIEDAPTIIEAEEW